MRAKDFFIQNSCFLFTWFLYESLKYKKKVNLMDYVNFQLLKYSRFHKRYYDESVSTFHGHFSYKSNNSLEIYLLLHF